MVETALADRTCEAINKDLEIHFWPVSDPPVGTPCKCGAVTRQPPRWHRPAEEETSR